MNKVDALILTKEEFLRTYWNYYLLLERDFMKVNQFITFCPENNNTFSIEFVKQYQTICSEFDTLFKFILKNENANIDSFKKFVKNSEHYKPMVDDKVAVKLNKVYFLFPFKNIDNLDWWFKYNQVKHMRTYEKNYSYANLENVFNSLAALFLLETYYYNEHFSDSGINIPMPYSQIFESQNLYERVILADDDGEILFCRDVPKEYLQ